ncbi:RNA polymerase sigma factor, sigma-70 family [Variovorax sp. CF313]|nr:RNA polymerase sigma factor, sigma-70 family [Variovorax sp. CF313]
MATLSVIRRWALREQMSIREIARRTGLSRNTVKKYLRAGEEEPRYAKRASSSKLDPYAEKLATWLAIEATKSRKQRRNLRQIHTKRRTPSTYPHREAFRLTKRVGQYSMEISGQRSAESNRTGIGTAFDRISLIRKPIWCPMRACRRSRCAWR